MDDNEESISQALRLELIRSMCEGIIQCIDACNNQANDYDDIYMVNGNHFPNRDSLSVTIGSDKDRDLICNHAINRVNININQSTIAKFIDYAPHVFRFLRNKCYNIRDIEYKKSFTLEDIQDLNIVSAKFRCVIVYKI